MIEFQNVNKIYKSKNSIDTLALNNVSLKFENKGMVFIVGKSGSGKSTLLNMLGGLDSVTSGKIFVDGKVLNDFSDKDLDSYRNSYVGFIFQDFNILEQYNVYENIDLSLRLQNKNNNKEEVREILNKLDLKGLENRRINELSGGQKQRVAIGRALIKQPKLILADEPTGNLDQKSGKQVFDYLKNISKDYLVLVVSHNMEAAEEYADRIIEIEDGEVIKDNNVCNGDLNNELSLIQPKLPFSYAFKMAISSFKNKPLKLFMTVLLTLISLVFFGVSMTLQLFNKDNLIINTMDDNENYVYSLEKTHFSHLGDSTLNLEDEDIEYFKDVIPTDLNIVYSIYNNGLPISFMFGKREDNLSNYSYYLNDVSYVSVVDVKDDRIYGKIIGKNISHNDEVIVHKYLADYIIKYGILSGKEFFNPTSYEDIVNSDKYFNLGNSKVKIVGIVDDDDSLYVEARRNEAFDDANDLIQYFIKNYSSKGNYIYTKDFVSNLVYEDNKEEAFLNSTYILGVGMTFDNLKLSDNEIDVMIEGKSVKRKLNKGEIVLSYNSFSNGLSFKNSFYEYFENNKDRTYNDVMNEFSKKYFEDNFLNKEIILYDKYEKTEEKLKIVGLTNMKNSFISVNYLDNFTPKTKDINSILVYEDNKSNLKNVFSKIMFKRQFKADEKFGTFYTYTVDHESDLFGVMMFYYETEWFIVAICLIFMIFALLLFSNFVGISISDSKKEIGILKALGAKNFDILKIYGIQTVIIAIISSIFGVIMWIVTCKVLNYVLFEDLYFKLNGIMLNPFIAIIIFVFMIAISLLITVASINKIVKIRPVDIILNK